MLMNLVSEVFKILIQPCHRKKHFWAFRVECLKNSYIIFMSCIYQWLVILNPRYFSLRWKNGSYSVTKCKETTTLGSRTWLLAIWYIKNIKTQNYNLPSTDKLILNIINFKLFMFCTQSLKHTHRVNISLMTDFCSTSMKHCNVDDWIIPLKRLSLRWGEFHQFEYLKFSLLSFKCPHISTLNAAELLWQAEQGVVNQCSDGKSDYFHKLVLSDSLNFAPHSRQLPGSRRVTKPSWQKPAS